MARSYPFNLIAAFSQSPFQGNPAAVVFIDDDTLETSTLTKIAANFNQPITSVVGPQIPSADADATVAAFRIRWFTASAHEVPLCGHGTMAAARAIFARGLVADSVETIEFHTASAGVMRARKVGAEGIQIRLPAGTLAAVSAEEVPKITAALGKAFGRDVSVKYIGAGSKGEGFTSYLVVELDEQENLGKCTVDMNAFLDTGYITNVITTAPSAAHSEALFVSRMFAPSLLPPPFSEDAVCGSAHCLLAPYWCKKRGLVSGDGFSAKQVSSRGGESGLVWEEGVGTVGIKGETFVIASGDIYV
ncbi:hypothetical protein FB451DRAFT_1216961 [Mycena latifolia]|nr:hypothetical protein FB451DRAFT_1216961 [Mycena latifolia]